MKIYLDGSTIYHDMERDLMKLKVCFKKCRECEPWIIIQQIVKL
jgi:hypothetical protein